MKSAFAVLAVFLACGCVSRVDAWRVTASVDMTADEVEDLDAALREWRSAVGECGPRFEVAVSSSPGAIVVFPGDPGSGRIFGMVEAGFEEGALVEFMGRTETESNRSKIVFRRARNDSERLDRRRVMRHELGHAFGLCADHRYETNPRAHGVMNATVELTDDDVAEYRSLWCD